MANTRSAAKRARLADKRQIRNNVQRGAARSSIKALVAAIDKKDAAAVKTTLADAMKQLQKTASRGAMPPGRAARKISRLTAMARKVSADAVNLTGLKKAAATAAATKKKPAAKKKAAASAQK